MTDQHDAFLEVLFSVSLLNVVEDFDADGLEDHYDQDDDGDDFNDSVEISNGFDPLNKWSHPDLPLVRTAKVFENNQTLVFGVEIMSSGGMEEMEAGILVFDDSGLLISEPTRDWNANTDSEINLSLNGFLKKGKKYAIRHLLAILLVVVLVKCWNI